MIHASSTALAHIGRASQPSGTAGCRAHHDRRRSIPRLCGPLMRCSCRSSCRRKVRRPRPGTGRVNGQAGERQGAPGSRESHGSAQTKERFPERSSGRRKLQLGTCRLTAGRSASNGALWVDVTCVQCARRACRRQQFNDRFIDTLSTVDSHSARGDHAGSHS